MEGSFRQGLGDIRDFADESQDMVERFQELRKN